MRYGCRVADSVAAYWRVRPCRASRSSWRRLCGALVPDSTIGEPMVNLIQNGHPLRVAVLLDSMGFLGSG